MWLYFWELQTWEIIEPKNKRSLEQIPIAWLRVFSVLAASKSFIQALTRLPIDTTQCQNLCLSSICHICYLAQPECKSLEIEVEDISNDRLLFSERELLTVRSSLCAEGYSSGAFREGMVFDVTGVSSSAVASELTVIEGLKGKLEPPFVFEY
jgi:hypothetical protein